MEGNPVVKGRSLQQLAELVQGQITGDPNTYIHDAVTIRRANAGTITICTAKHLIDELHNSEASAVVTTADISGIEIPSIVVKNPKDAFGRIVSEFRPDLDVLADQREQASIAQTASLDDDCIIRAGATIGENVSISRGTVIHSGATVLDESRIGEDTIIYPGTVIYPNTVIGDRVIVHANAVLGANGFGYDTIDGRHILSHQLGNVVLHDDVEIGAGTTIDRGTWDSTVIGEGTKIDNQVMIGHNCQIGKHNIICAQVGIAGSSTTGDYVIMGGQAGIKDHVNIGDHVTLGAQSGVLSNLEGPATFMGSPCFPIKKQMAVYVHMQKLPEMRKQLKEHGKQLEQLNDFLSHIEQNAPPSASQDAA